MFETEICYSMLVTWLKNLENNYQFIVQKYEQWSVLLTLQ